MSRFGRPDGTHGGARPGCEAAAQRLVELHLGQHLLKAAVRQREFARQHRSLHVEQHQQVDLPFALQRLRALQRAAAVIDGARQRSGSVGLLGAHEQAVLDLLHGDQHRLLPGQQRLVGPRRLRADAGVDAARIEDRCGKGQRDIREVHRREIERIQSQILAAEQGAQEELGPILGARLGAAQRLGRDARLGNDQVGPAPQQFAGLAGTDLARRRPREPCVLVDHSLRWIAAEQHGQPRLRDAGQRSQRRHLSVECIGLGARPVQVKGAGLAFAKAAGDAARGLALGRGEGLHDAQTLRGAAQHEVLPRHLAGHQQPRAFDSGRCGGGIGLRRVARRPHATGEVDLPGHVEAGTQRTRVGHALLDRCGQSAVAVRGGRLRAHRGPQPRTMGIAAGASLGDALQGDRDILVGSQGLLDQCGQHRIAVAAPPRAIGDLDGSGCRPGLRECSGQRHRSHGALHGRHRAGRQDRQRRGGGHQADRPGAGLEAAVRGGRHEAFHIVYFAVH